MSHFHRTEHVVADERKCPSCGELLGLHSQADIGSAPIDSPEEARLKDAIARRVWSEAQIYQHANAITDIRVWRAIRCDDGRVGVVTLLMPIDPCASDRYDEPRFLPAVDGENLLDLVGDALKIAR